MKSRISNIEETKIDVFSRLAKYSLLAELNLFSGPIKLDELITQYITYRETRAREMGRKEVIDEIESSVREQVDDYIELITKIVDVIFKASQENFAAGNLKVVSAHTNFYLDTKQTRVLFVIDADLKNEADFSDMLTATEKFLLEKKNTAAELLFVNQRNAEVDHISISCDFPFQRVRNSGS